MLVLKLLIAKVSQFWACRVSLTSNTVKISLSPSHTHARTHSKTHIYTYIYVLTHMHAHMQMDITFRNTISCKHPAFALSQEDRTHQGFAKLGLHRKSAGNSFPYDLQICAERFKRSHTLLLSFSLNCHPCSKFIQYIQISLFLYILRSLFTIYIILKCT